MSSQETRDHSRVKDSARFLRIELDYISQSDVYRKENVAHFNKQLKEKLNTRRRERWFGRIKYTFGYIYRYGRSWTVNYLSHIQSVWREYRTKD